MPDFRMEGEGLWQDPISSAGWNSNGLGTSLELPFVHRVHETRTGNHVEAVIITQSAPDGVSQHFVGVLVNELQLAPKGAAGTKIGELM